MLPFLGKAAEVAFCILRNKYGIERRKRMTSKTSGSGTKDIQVQISILYPYLTSIFSQETHYITCIKKILPILTLNAVLEITEHVTVLVS